MNFLLINSSPAEVKFTSTLASGGDWLGRKLMCLGNFTVGHAGKVTRPIASYHVCAQLVARALHVVIVALLLWTIVPYIIGGGMRLASRQFITQMHQKSPLSNTQYVLSFRVMTNKPRSYYTEQYQSLKAECIRRGIEGLIFDDEGERIWLTRNSAEYKPHLEVIEGYRSSKFKLCGCEVERGYTVQKILSRETTQVRAVYSRCIPKGEDELRAIMQDLVDGVTSDKEGLLFHSLCLFYYSTFNEQLLKRLIHEVDVENKFPYFLEIVKSPLTLDNPSARNFCADALSAKVLATDECTALSERGSGCVADLDQREVDQLRDVIPDFYAQGIDQLKGGLTSMLNIILEGGIRAGQSGPLGDRSAYATNVFSGTHGPFFVLTKSNTTQIIAYSVPKESDRQILFAVLDRAGDEGVLKAAFVEEVKAQVYTHKEIYSNDALRDFL